MSGRGTWSWINLFNHCVAQNCEKEQIHVRIVYHFWNSLTRFITVACLADILITPCYHILVPIRVGRAWPTKKRQGQGHACHGQTRGTRARPTLVSIRITQVRITLESTSNMGYCNQKLWFKTFFGTLPNFWNSHVLCNFSPTYRAPYRFMRILSQG